MNTVVEELDRAVRKNIETLLTILNKVENFTLEDSDDGVSISNTEAIVLNAIQLEMNSISKQVDDLVGFVKNNEHINRPK